MHGDLKCMHMNIFEIGYSNAYDIEFTIPRLSSDAYVFRPGNVRACPIVQGIKL